MLRPARQNDITTMQYKQKIWYFALKKHFCFTNKVSQLIYQKYSICIHTHPLENTQTLFETESFKISSHFGLPET